MKEKQANSSQGIHEKINTSSNSSFNIENIAAPEIKIVKVTKANILEIIQSFQENEVTPAVYDPETDLMTLIKKMEE